MWISQNIRYRPLFGEAFVSSGNKSIAPYGFASVAPSNTRGVAVPCENGDVMLGYDMLTAGLKSGEVEIYSSSGAFIKLCKNGSVIINGLVISSDGEIDGGSSSGSSGGSEDTDSPYD